MALAASTAVADDDHPVVANSKQKPHVKRFGMVGGMRGGRKQQARMILMLLYLNLVEFFS
jgi:hypothetical protein